jgi:3-oxoacyl-[acyl-carrier protein] reductase
MNAARDILITGAGRGLGRAMAIHLGRPGTRLYLHHHQSRDGADEAARILAAEGADGVPLQADLSSAPARKALIAEVARRTDRLDVLIHNASLYDPVPLLDGSAEDWSRILEVSCTAVFDLTQMALPLLRKPGGARVILLGDSGADRIQARTQAVAYHVAKLGVHVLTRSFAKALGADGITVNQISPGVLENSVDGPESPIPLGRFGRFEDVLGALDFLLSPEADYVSGANIVVSGGWNL